MELKNYVAEIQDFPIEGILFRDVTPLMQDGAAYKACIDEIIAYWYADLRSIAIT